MAKTKWNGTDSRAPHIELNTPQRQTVADTSFQTGISTLARWITTTKADPTGTITNPNVAVNGDGRIVLGADGIYRIIVSYAFGNSTAGTTRQIRLLLAGSTPILADNRAPAGVTTVGGSVEREFSAGDYFTTEILQASGGALASFSSGEGYSRLHITRTG